MAYQDDWGFVPPEQRTPEQQEYNDTYWEARRKGWPHEAAYDMAYPGAREFFDGQEAPPGLAEQLGMVAGLAGAGAVGMGLGNRIGEANTWTGLGDWFSGLFGGGGAGGAGTTTIPGSMLDVGPEVGKLLGGAEASSASTALESSEGLLGEGAAANLAAILAAGYFANRAYEQGGKEVLTGNAHGRDWTNTALNTNLLTMGVNPILGLFGFPSVGKMTSSGKSKAQQMRDKARDVLEDAGVATVNEKGSHIVTLADGSVFDIGRDGKSSYLGNEMNATGHRMRLWDVDRNNEAMSNAANMLDPLTVALFGSSPWGSQMIGYLSRAATSSGDPAANIAKMYADAGMSYEDVFARIGDLANEGKIDMWSAHALQNQLNQLMGKTSGTSTPGFIAESDRPAFIQYQKEQAKKFGMDPNVDFINPEGYQIETNMPWAFPQASASPTIPNKSPIVAPVGTQPEISLTPPIDIAAQIRNRFLK